MCYESSTAQGYDAMSELETKARERIARLKLEIESLEEFLRVTGQARQLLEGDVSSTNLSIIGFKPVSTEARAFDNTAPEGPESPPPRTRVRDNPKPAVLIPAVEEILRERGRPMSRRELHEALSDRGLEVRGAEPTKTLGTILWRARDLISSIEGRGYWPKGDPVPPAFSLSDDLKDLLS